MKGHAIANYTGMTGANQDPGLSGGPEHRVTLCLVLYFLDSLKPMSHMTHH